MKNSCLLKVGVLGINFKTADLSLREEVARASLSLSGEKSLFLRYPTALLSTCNRTEIYFSAEDLSEAQRHLLSLLRQHIDSSFEQKLYSFFGIDCFVHLCKVAAGLDSAILAETEIQRQVKSAYAKSCAYFSLPPHFHYVFQKALHVAKQTRARLFLKKSTPTLFSTLLQLARKKFSNLHEKKILLIGYSEINRAFAQLLERKGVHHWTFCTRYPEKVSMKGGSICDRKELEQWFTYDLITCASQEDDFLIHGKGAKEHLIFDLSVPRNVDPLVGETEGVTLFNIEQIDRLIETHRGEQSRFLEQCEQRIWNQTIRLARLYRAKRERALCPCDFSLAPK